MVTKRNWLYDLFIFILFFFLLEIAAKKVFEIYNPNSFLLNRNPLIEDHFDYGSRLRRDPFRSGVNFFLSVQV